MTETFKQFLDLPDQDKRDVFEATANYLVRGAINFRIRMDLLTA